MPGWRPLIVCDGIPRAAANGLPALPKCDFNSVIVLIQNGIHDLVLISTIFVVIVIILSGLKLITSGGDAGARKEVSGRLWNLVLGYLWILGAWLVVYTISRALLAPDFSLLYRS